MDATVSYDKDPGFCMINSRGVFRTVQDAREVFAPAIPVLEKHNCKRVLFDHRDAGIDARTMDIFDVAAKPEAWGWKRDYRAAVLYSEDYGPDTWLETVGVNRGVIMKVFTDYEEAVSWLMG